MKSEGNIEAAADLALSARHLLAKGAKDMCCAAVFLSIVVFAAG